MAFRDPENNLAITQILDPAVVTSDQNCTGVDLLGYDGVMFIANVGESGDTLSGSVYLELEVEDSADNSTYADAADSEITNAVTGNNTGCFGVIDAAAEDDAVFTTVYRGDKRYARVVANVTGTHTNGIPVSVTAVRFGKQTLPVA